MKFLDGSELAGYIKERQAKEVRSLRQAHGIPPKLLILRDNSNPVIDKYVGLKKAYANDILIDVEDKILQGMALKEEILRANTNTSIHGIVVQLPLQGMALKEEILESIDVKKDVDDLTGRSNFTGATPLAIDWLLAGYNVNLEQSKIAIVGRGQLVGAPLEKLWQARGLNITVFEKDDGQDLATELPKFNVVVTATGVPGLIAANMIGLKTVVVDAGTSEKDGALVGDVADDVYARDDITITPKVGGVGPLTIAALIDNLIKAATKTLRQ
ncbi:bifunctional 5,10-methylenetetrahydrofolate dehydrogenase/5,10-methenyltetrahydrofolate cyclohydrolase [Candidatus Saccharibacteria bacterium]|nr:bifunctional 5,10-methylenetetrahydrofolate dehydrogenase/5,10-methenyltetrahydrofolate cyclohydrolase [Candidatus Saccharibacteria bacterium]